MSAAASPASSAAAAPPAPLQQPLRFANRVSAATAAWRLRLAMVVAVLAVFALAWLDLRRSQISSADDLLLAQRVLAAEVAAAAAARLDAAVADLSAAAEVARLPSAQAGSRLERIARRGSASPPYGEVDLMALGEGWRPLLELPLPGREALSRSARLDAARRDLLVRLAAAPEGVPASSPLLPDEAAAAGERDGDRLRGEERPDRLLLVGLRLGDRGAVVALPVSRLLERPGDAGSEASNRRLLLDSLAPEPAAAPVRAPRWLAIGGAMPARWVEVPAGRAGQLRALAAAMERGERGAVRLLADDAAVLGLGRQPVAVGYAPVVGGGLRLAVAVATSASRMQMRQRLGVARLAASTGLAALLVALFGLVLLRKERRERDLAEQLHLAAATAALSERSEKIVETIPVGVLALAAGPEERVAVVNRYLVERGVVGGGDLATALPHATPDELAQLRALLAAAAARRTPGERPGLRLRLGGAELRDVDVYAVPLLQPLPDVSCFLLLHDRTETRALERSLMRAEKLATMGTLAAGVAHEVGTPLAIITGRAEQLLSRPVGTALAEADRRSLASILAQVDRVSSTIRQLLDFARPRPVETRQVVPAAVLQSAAALLEHRFRQAGVALRIEVAPGLTPLPADAELIEQAVVNLVVNACDACGQGGLVRLRAAEEQGNLLIEVTDDGCGIAPEHLPHVLDPFFTTKKRGQGTGLGLSIVADIVRNHRGTLEIDSQPGGGTAVRVRLPVGAATPDGDPGPGPVVPPPKNQTVTDPRRPARADSMPIVKEDHR